MPGRRYAEAAIADQQAPMTAVIPQRLWTLTVLMLGGLCLVAGVQAFYGQAGLRPPDSWWRAVAAWDVVQAGGLASWFSSIFLLAAGFQGVQIYRLRRHRADDYRGRYRVWLWICPILFAQAAAVGTHVHGDLIHAVLRGGDWGARWQPYAVPSLVPAAVWLLVALRLAFEMRESRIALAALAVSVIAYPAAVLVEWLFPAAPLSLIAPMVASSLVMTGHLAVFLTVATYARHVYLDAHGRIPVATEAGRSQRRAKRKVAVPGDAVPGDAVPGDAVPGDAGEASPQVISLVDARAQRQTPRESPAAVPSESPRPERTAGSPAEAEPPLASQAVDAVDEAVDSSLSRAERRRQRKMQRREHSRKAA